MRGTFLLFAFAVILAANPILNLPSGVPAGSLTVSTYASGLSFPDSMQVLSDGSLLVGVSTPNSSNDYFSSSGGLVRIAGAGATPTTVLSGLPYPTQDVQTIANNLIAVSEAGTGGNQIVFLAPGATPTAPYTNLGAINFTPSNAGEEFNMTLASRPTPGQPGSYDLFFSMNGDTDHTQSTNSATLSGLSSGTIPYNTIGMVTVTPGAGGAAPTVSGVTEIADGIRNADGLVFDSAGNLYSNDNGWDVPGTTTPQSADELNFLAAASIGNGIANYGFPDNYIEYGTGTFIGGQDIAPLAAFQPLNGVQSLGISEMALAPADFPAGLNDGLFITFYGVWEQGGVNNTTGPLLYYSFATGQYTDIILPGQAGIGHLDGITSTANALFLSDMNSTGQIRSGPQDGVIYEIQATPTPEPSSFYLMLFSGALLFAGLRFRRSRGAP